LITAVDISQAATAAAAAFIKVPLSSKDNPRVDVAQTPLVRFAAAEDLSWICCDVTTPDKWSTIVLRQSFFASFLVQFRTAD